MTKLINKIILLNANAKILSLHGVKIEFEFKEKYSVKVIRALKTHFPKFKFYLFEKELTVIGKYCQFLIVLQ